jgi:hypothetical protein
MAADGFVGVAGFYLITLPLISFCADLLKIAASAAIELKS